MKNYLYIFVSDPKAIKVLKYVKLIQANGTEIQFNLEKINKSFSVYSTGSIDIPKGSFKILVNGVDRSDVETNLLVSKAVKALNPGKIIRKNSH